SRSLPRPGIARVRQAVDPGMQGGRLAGDRLRRVRRGIRPLRPRRERAAHQAGAARSQDTDHAVSTGWSRSSPRSPASSSDWTRNPIKIGLLGPGTVGAGVVKVLDSHRTEMQERVGARLEIHRIADADLTRRREGLDLARLPLVPDANQVL